MSAPAFCALGSLILLSACSSTAAVRGPEPSASSMGSAGGVEGGRPLFPLFPPASGGLELDWPAGGDPPSMLELILRYGELTGQTIAFNPQYDAATRELLEADRIPLASSTRVPAAEVQSFVESMLAGEYTLSLGSTESPRAVFVHGLKSPARTHLRSQAITLPSEAVARARDHPAVMFTTLVDLPHSDVRTLSNTMRSLIVDPNLLTIIPVGKSTLVMTGLGPELANLVEHLRAIDASQAPTRPVIHHELVRLFNAQAPHLAPLVQKAFPEAVIQPYEDLNALVITCPEGAREQIRTLIAELDTE